MSLLNDVNAIDEVVRQLQKMESKLLAGQIIGAYRDCNALQAKLLQHKQDILKSQEEKNVK